MLIECQQSGQTLDLTDIFRASLWRSISTFTDGKRTDQEIESFTLEKIIAELRQIEVLISQGQLGGGRLPGGLESRNRAITRWRKGVWV